MKSGWETSGSELAPQHCRGGRLWRPGAPSLVRVGTILYLCLVEQSSEQRVDSDRLPARLERWPSPGSR